MNKSTKIKISLRQRPGIENFKIECNLQATSPQTAV